MADKKKKKDEEKKSEEKPILNEDGSNKEEPSAEILQEINPEFELEDKSGSEEILQIEYFSKEDLAEKIEELENQLKTKDDNLTKILEEKDKQKSRLMHLQAEFENAQKRWDKSRQELRTQSTASVLKNFLSLYDSFSKAIDNEPENETLKSFFNQLLNIFKSYQVEPIEVNVNDKFDYSIHEALTSIEKEDVPENSIVDIIQDGFKIGKEVLRYTRVVISKKPKPPEPEPEPEKEEKIEEEGQPSEQMKKTSEKKE